jgi:hypothetical protein
MEYLGFMVGLQELCLASMGQVGKTVPRHLDGYLSTRIYKLLFHKF